MGVIFFIVLIALALSLYDFFSTRDTNRLSAKVAAEKNQKYGAYAIQKSYNIILSLILLGFLLIAGGYMAFERGFGYGWNDEPQPQKEKIDTFLLTINAPPLEHNETLPPSYKLNGKQGEGTPSAAAPQQNEPPAKEEKQPKKTDNNVEVDKPKNTSPEKPPKQKKYSSIEERIKAEERQMFEEAGGEAKRAEIRRKAEEDKKRNEEEQRKKNAAQSQANKQNNGGNNGSKGMPMASFELEGRTKLEPYEFVDNPGYTCQQGVSGKVVIKIKVNSSGSIIYAEPMNPEKLNPCLVQQSKIYAKKSKFIASSSALREGTITYVFAP